MSYPALYAFSAVVLAVSIAGLWYVRRTVPEGVLRTLGLAFTSVLGVMGALLLALTMYGQFYLVPPGEGPVRLGDGGEMDEPATDFAFRLVGTDEAARLSDYDGQVVLLNLWATWCAPCLEEMPDLSRLQSDYRERGLAVLTVSDEDRATLLDFERERPLQTVSGYLENDALPEPFSFFVRPTTYLIDRSGQVRIYVLGARDYAFWTQLLDPYLGEEAVAAR